MKRVGKVECRGSPPHRQGLVLYSLVLEASCAKCAAPKRNESKLLILACSSRRLETKACRSETKQRETKRRFMALRSASAAPERPVHIRALSATATHVCSVCTLSCPFRDSNTKTTALASTPPQQIQDGYGKRGYCARHSLISWRPLWDCPLTLVFSRFVSSITAHENHVQEREHHSHAERNPRQEPLPCRLLFHRLRTQLLLRRCTYNFTTDCSLPPVQTHTLPEWRNQMECIDCLAMFFPCC